ncbi:DNA-3-methyladenine glycosylase I [Staphylococcus ureilyticus]|uniref:DNA-3-methyladenine glycosylase I n=1 Tax=Staphylococcus TaxID=1279 RepID=UPI0006192C13|nr:MULTISPECIES: DNA-3-methyladenine glycosylase I [Staphylococcus]AQM41707.1 DNA-3-methyladenine glycosylase [Staphylococcus cohnii]KKD24382.1 DNA-3-methyladenine glycosylase [Staphylococcus cohnii subsp. cohnii]KKD24399.1 DNA-3-methyladenine glycosylase [Staphylococcus cohnii subsp. cohnii]MBM9446317.1 DNA-3-methyladenine glycosylase I [Staphylococcus ureilyticus]MCQ9292483.1 DNA-3-methyladenine glycosylase I [Staphylococcus cohnii]
MNECAFGTTDPVYINYHNESWGHPIYDSLKLFKLMALESQHAGLSWLTILKKKEAYEQAFYNFNPAKIVKMTSEDIDKLMAFPNIVHNRKKLEAIVNQAKGYFKIEQDYGSFSKFLWSYVDHKPLDLGYIQSSERITVDQRATELSKKLKQYGFSFLGPVTVFSFLEAAGLYNAHLQSCPYNPNIYNGEGFH